MDVACFGWSLVELIFIIVPMLSEKARVEDVCLGSQLLAGDRYVRGGSRDENFYATGEVIGVALGVSSTRTREDFYFSVALVLQICLIAFDSTLARFTRCHKCPGGAYHRRRWYASIARVVFPSLLAGCAKLELALQPKPKLRVHLRGHLYTWA